MLARAAPASRGARFARRMTGAPRPVYSDLAKVPEWLSEPAEARERLAALAGLLRYRAAIDVELSGPRLAMIAEAVGEDLFDAACNVAVERGTGAASPGCLPPPEAIVQEGRKLLEAALPLAFAAVFPGARDDEAAAALAAQAHAIERAGA